VNVNPFPNTIRTTGEPLNTGEAIYPRINTSGGPSLASQSLCLSFWTAATNGNATSVVTVTTGTAASGLTYAAVGIYLVDALGNLTLQTSTGDLHSTLWAATFTTYTSTLTTAFSRAYGQRYALGCLAVGTTPPTLAGPPGTGFYAYAPFVAGSMASQATLPATIAAASVTGANQVAEAILTP
jgi:hypothetical protein